MLLLSKFSSKVNERHLKFKKILSCVVSFFSAVSHNGTEPSAFWDTHPEDSFVVWDTIEEKLFQCGIQWKKASTLWDTTEEIRQTS